MFAIILQYKKPIEEVERYTEAHRAFLDQYYAQGILVMSGRQNPPKGGVIIANAKNRQQLDRILSEDPYNQAGIAEYDIYEFTPGKYQPVLKELIEA